MKFTDEGSVSLRVRVVDSTNTRVRLEFVVRDCGIGIPESEIGRIFSPFMQVDESATRRFGGTGLGLAISKRLVELMGGTLTVGSRVNKGSTFRLSWPSRWLKTFRRVMPVRSAPGAMFRTRACPLGIWLGSGSLWWRTTSSISM